jgi:hypothetical protein
MEDGSWAKTDIVQGYRNSGRWQPIIDSGVNTTVDGLVFKSENEINADCFPRIILKPLVVAEKVKDIPIQEKLI